MRKEIKDCSFRILSVLLCFLLLFTQFSFVAFAEENVRDATVWAVSVRVRSGPGTNTDALMHNGAQIKLNTGDQVKVYGDKVTGTDPSYPEWYKIGFTYDGTWYEGYIFWEYITIKNTGDIPVVPNPDFETQLAAFPDSYKEVIRALHEQHPSWNFEVFDTGLEWNWVQSLENRLGWSYINDGIISHYSTAPGAYDWETDTYIVKEGSNWYQASPEMVAYYMDPRNFINENDIFQFEKLAFSAATQTEENIASMLKGSFMEGKTTVNNQGESVSYARAFLDAAYAANVSAFHLVTRCIQEVGWDGSPTVHGSYGGEYNGYYNFFNIGANTGAQDGMAYAKNHGWDTPYKAIMAGGDFISTGYITRGQDTPYFQKYNVVDKNNVAGHQYMTNIAAAYSEGRIQKGEYAQLGMTESAFTFRIPVFLNMPATACQAPAPAGSPNNYLKALSVEGYSLTPTFDFYDSLYNGTKNYSLIINGDVPSVNVTASAISSSATLSGNLGNVPIATGENLLQIVCTAANGATRVYTIRIVLNGQGSAEGPPAVDLTPTPSGWNPPYAIKGSNVSGITPGTDSAAFLSSLGAYGNASVALTDENGNAISGAMRTGMVLHYFDGTYMTQYRIVIYGDVNGDSAIDAIDLLLIRKNLLGLTSPGEAYKSASDINRDGAVDAIDLLLVRKQLLGLYSITQ